MKQQVPGETLMQWKDKRKSAVDRGHPAEPLLEYADFTDYFRIIDRNDNWEKVFKAVFSSKDDIRESFQRLYPIRLAAMHARLIDQDDELILYVEIKRILSSMGVLRRS